MPNRIIVGVTIGRLNHGEFTTNWLAFTAQISRYAAKHEHPQPGVLMTSGSYVHHNQNRIIGMALQAENWDYLLMVEDDQKMPPGLLDRVGQYDQPIVGVQVYGRVQDNQAPIAGRFIEDGLIRRLTWEETKPMIDAPGLYRVDSVGLGCTAIRRDVLESWPQPPYTDEQMWKGPRLPWLRMMDMPDGRMFGHDVTFCKDAAALGHEVWLDTTLCSDHLGVWWSNETTYRATNEYLVLQQAGLEIRTA